MSRFDDIAARHRQSSLVQASAGAQLIGLLDISAGAELLDVGCGTGNLTAALAGKGCGRVIGIDTSEAMFHETAHLDGIERSFVSLAEAAGKLDLVFNRIFVVSERQTAQPTSP